VKPLAFRSDADVTAALGPAIAHLRAGRLLAYPTETVYGLGSRAREDDVRALAELKGRRADKPFLLLVSSREMAEGFGLAFNASAVALARARRVPGRHVVRDLPAVWRAGQGRLLPRVGAAAHP